MGRCNPQPLPFWSLPTPESPISPNVLHTASTKAQAARAPNDERNEDRQSSTCQREGAGQKIGGLRGRSEPGRAKQPDRRIAAPQAEPKSASRRWCRKATAPQVEHKSARSRAVRPGDVKARRDWTSVHRGGLERLRDAHRGFAASSSSGGRQAVGTPESIAAGLSGFGTCIAASQRRAVPAAVRPPQP